MEEVVLFLGGLVNSFQPALAVGAGCGLGVVCVAMVTVGLIVTYISVMWREQDDRENNAS